MKNPEDEPIELVKLKPSGDWIATFWCIHCKAYHHMLLLKLRVNFKAVLVERAANPKKCAEIFGQYKSRGGAPDDKVLDDIAENFGPEDDYDEDDEDEDEDD